MYLVPADDISNENPTMIGQLGYGRVNIFNALNEPETDLSKKLKLSLSNILFY